VVSDLDADGVLDLAVTNSTSDDLSVLLGLGGGSFAPAVSYAVGLEPVSVRVLEWNGDAIPDLVVANRSGDSLTMLLGLGGGSFQAGTTLALTDGPFDLAVADVDVDGHTDLIALITSTRELAILFGDGSGSILSTSYTSVADSQGLLVEDFNGDGWPDVALSGVFITVLPGNGDGTFGTGIGYQVGNFQLPYARFISSADLDGDGESEILISQDPHADFLVLTGVPGGFFVSLGEIYQAPGVSGKAATGDIDGDGALDVAVPGDVLNVFRGDGQGGLATQLTYDCRGTPSGLAVGDFDRDGVPDVVASCEATDSICLLTGQGGGALGMSGSHLVGDQPRSVAAADFNLDGSLDVCVANKGSDTVSVLLGDGLGGFGPQSTFSVGVAPNWIRTGLLNADGFPDVITANLGSTGPGGVSVLIGVGDGSFLPRVDYLTTTSSMSVDVGDLNGDGEADIVAAAEWPSGENVGVLLGVGDGTFSPGAARDMDWAFGPVSLVGHGSLNGPSLAAPGWQFDPLVVTRSLNGDGTFGLSGFLYGGSSPQYVANVEGVGGFVASGVSGVARLGGGQAGDLQAGDSPFYLFGADMNSDGVPDLVVANGSGAGISILLGGGGVVDDEYAPNASCQLAPVIGAGLYTGLVTLGGVADDFFAVDVLPGDTLTASVLHIAADGDLDSYLYEASLPTHACGDDASFLASSTTSSNDELLSWTNQTGVTQTYFIQVRATGASGTPMCNEYDLHIEIGPAPIGVPICAGDGSLIDCPCDNESTDSESGCVNATGLGAKIAATGSASVSADDVVFHISQGRVGQPSLLIQGWTLTALPFKDGILCMGNPTERVEVVLLDGVGGGSTSSSIVTEGSIPGPGVTRYYQFWYRDPQLGPCGTGSNFTNGLSVDWM